MLCTFQPEDGCGIVTSHSLVGICDFKSARFLSFLTSGAECQRNIVQSNPFCHMSLELKHLLLKRCEKTNKRQPLSLLISYPMMISNWLSIKISYFMTLSRLNDCFQLFKFMYLILTVLLDDLFIFCLRDFSLWAAIRHSCIHRWI